MTRWRVGPTLGRTIYAQKGPEPSKDDEFLGIMETRELAEWVVLILNLSEHNDPFSASFPYLVGKQTERIAAVGLPPELEIGVKEAETLFE